MGKFNLKFVKPVASLVIGAAVLTGSFAATGASETAFAKEETVKVTKGKLVSVKSSKVVKGYKSYQNVLYKNGNKFTGLYKKTFYKSGKKGTGIYKSVYYIAGKKGAGWYGSGSAKKWYYNGKPLTGIEGKSNKLYVNGKVANGVVNYNGAEKLYKDGMVVSMVIGAVKAVNNTTVEVTFENAQNVSEVTAGRFAIEGLTISSATVKATDPKVVVLVTSAQEAGKAYNVAIDGGNSSIFFGVSAVIPTAIKLSTPSVQAVVGNQVTVEAQVEVAAGQSKAKIPVTFDVENSADATKKLTTEVLTDENGVASYSYTQSSFSNDTVSAYATKNVALKSSASKVYWGNNERLTIVDVTEGSTLANGAKKVYKVNVNPADVSSDTKGKYVNVTFAENVNVTLDKIDRKATVVESNNTTPYQTANGQVGAKVYVNTNGVGTFTVTGASTSVTPIVFANGKETRERLDVTGLQAKGSTVKFEIKHTIALNVEAIGTENASNASTERNVAVGGTYAANFGGRQYKATVTDLAGNKAPANIAVKVVLQGDTQTAHIFQAGKAVNLDRNGLYSLVTDKNGVVEFTVVNRKVGSYITPTVFIDNGSSTAVGRLDDADLQQVAPITYFNDAIVNTAKVKFYNAKGEEVTATRADSPVTVNYQTVDQNGLPYAPKVGGNVTFEFTTVFGTIILSNGIGKVITPGSPDNKQMVLIGKDGNISFTMKSSHAGILDIRATASDSIIESVATALNVTDQATAFEKVNSVTEITEMLSALYEIESFKAKLDRLTYANKTTIAKFVIEKRPAGTGYANQTDLEKEFNVKYNELNF
ncbi:hypothetical protein JFL43_07755 [Viridibacillus sp. YIM B01967]|uniref:S-layer protein n=1 Tax=Viridibacillus soli TaxID=2798301 RepID=A0ABS1H5Q7_9BACL|nr:hypothetical protein [Viridibacillus soli]MBK3494752.1 hypothetical protein [Viridibacillus soli]